MGLYRGNIENEILSEITRPIASTFVMLQNLVGLCQVCSNYDHMAKNGTILGVACFAKAYIRKIWNKIFLSQTTGPRLGMVFGM